MESTKESLLVKMVLDAWFSKVEKANQLLNSLTEEDLLKEVANGRSRGIYLLGHLTAVHDRLFPLLGFGNAIYPELYATFVDKPDKAVAEITSAKALKDNWKNVNDTLEAKYNTTSVAEWFQKHTSVSEADFVKEPHRNKLNVIISRTNHLEHHLGQLTFLLKNQSL